MLPADPIILLSYLNTQLRAHYASLAVITPTCIRTALCPARGKVLVFWVNRSAVCCARHA